MKLRRDESLPPGQRLVGEMPRFGDRPLLAPPTMPADPQLQITSDGEPLAVLTGSDLEALGPREQRADFHCVTTWSARGLIWTGVPLREVFASLGITETPFLVARSGDRRQAAFAWEDATAADVVLATHLNGARLDDRHGAPLRLVAPSQYAYKSVKHLASIDLRTARPRTMSKEHLRARVALEERHPKLAGRGLRLPYRMLITPTAYLAERTLERHRAGEAVRR